jgi:hypothetical protein
MAVCSGIKADGTRCRAQAMRDSTFCLNHDPDRAEENRRRASRGGKRGGRGRPLSEINDVKRDLRDLARKVMEGEAKRADAAVAGQLLGTYIRAVSVEAKLKEVLEFEERLAALEAKERTRREWQRTR